jgi:regulator of replication initiation timing
MNMNDNERSLLTENESLRAENMELRSLLTLAKEARAEAAERALERIIEWCREYPCVEAGTVTELAMIVTNEARAAVEGE